ncbi:MAG: DUF2062 domain-containing protein [Novosphingobium sp.]
MSSFVARMAGWAHRNMPKREEMEHNRWIGPFARRPELWRFTRRSVPRGVAVGLLVGIFALIPGIQIVGSALMCVPCRGNIPLAALMTFLSNPLTTPFILIASAWVGNNFGFHADMATLSVLMERGASLGEWATWFFSDAAPSVLFGLFVISTVTAAVGYLVASFSWNWWVRHKRKVKLATLGSARE